MPHPLVDQLRFARSEFQRGLVGLTDAEARQRFMPLNCISWNIGHLAWQEQNYWLLRAQDQMLLPEVNTAFAFGAPASTPPLDEMQAAWAQIAQAADPWLDTLTTAELERPKAYQSRSGNTYYLTFGSLMLRTIYHYWYHNGENLAIRQNLGHSDLPQFVGNIDEEAPYRPE